MKKIITSFILLFGVLSTLFAANTTLYYVNSTKWATVNGYVWNNTTMEVLAAWPGTTMTKTSEIAKGFDVYSYTFDAAKYDRIIFNGNGQTGDLTFSTSKPYYYEGAWYATLAEINGADAPAELTLYYVNTTKWSKVNAYAWIDGGAPLSAWPGAAATLMDKTVSGNQVYSYTFNPAMANQIIFNNGVSQTDDLTIDATKPYFYNNRWVASVTFDATPVVPTPTYEPIYLRGNVNAWGVDDDWKLTTTDGNYFVANYAAGSEVELSGSFKLGSGTTDWTPYDFGADIEVEAGKSYVLTAGGGNINVSGKILVSKIEFTLSTKTLKITGQTLEDKFDVTTDQGIALVENLDGTLQYIPLEFQANGVYNGVYEFAKSETSMPMFKVGGTADLNTIDFGDNGTSIIRLDQPYTLKRGSSNFVAINQTDLGSQGVDNGTKFDVTVTFTEDWGVTLKFVKQAEPVVTRITNVYVETFANTTINKTSIVNASYYLYYADEAVPTISGEDAAYFTLSDITLSEEFFIKGEPVREGDMIITFAPTEARLYKATLTITSGDVSESVDFTAQGKAPNVTISNLQVPSFAVTEPFATTTVTATYNLANATEATATLGGDINAFSIVKQEVKDGVGSVQISFTPGASGTYNATLVILSGDAEARVDFSATASQVDVDADKITIYARENRCDDNSVTFYCYNTADATSPSKTVHGTKVAGMYINGMDVYKVEIPFNNPIYVSAINDGDAKQYIDSPIVKYYREGKWYDSFDDCRFGYNLIDVNQKPEAGKLYVICGNYVSGLYKVFSSKYGEDSGYSPTATTLDETFFGLTIKTYDVDPTIYDKVVYYYSPGMILGDKIENDIDWSKPYLCDGTWYASLAELSTRIVIEEVSYWVPFIGKDNKGIPGTQAVCKGNNVHESITQWNVTSETGKELDIVYALDPTEYYYNGTNTPLGSPAGYEFPCETVNKTIAVPEILGKYNLILTLDATAKEISAKWELIDTNVKVSLTNVFTGVSMEAVAANQYTYTYKKRMKAGLYYYSISDNNNDFSKDNQVVEVGEDGVYSFTFTYNATNKTVACKLEKVPSQEITLYYVNENTNAECAYAFAYTWIQSSGDFVAAYPGEEMTDTGKTVDGYQVLSYTLDLAEADHILFNNAICGDKTIDLAIDPAKPYYYQGEWHESLTFDEAPTGETTLYYVNKMGITDTEWENAFAYAYDNATGTPIVPWPGTPMGKLTKTIDGYDVFACTVDLSKADYIVFTNGQGGSLSQTMDLKIEPLKPYYYQLIWHGKLTFDDGTTEPGEILDPVLPDHEPIYLRGEINSWGVDENYKLTSIDGIRYSVTYAPGSEIELYGSFKLASGNDTWYPFNFGAYPTKPIITAGQDFVALRDGNDNIQVDGRILVSKIEFDLNTYTIKITGESQKFDITSDQGVSVVVYVGEESTFIPLTFTENGAYTGSFTVTDEDFSLKIAGTSDYNTINYGTNGTSAKFKFLYALKQSAFESITIDDEYEVGDVINVLVVFEEDWSAIMNLNRQTPMPDDGYEPLYLRGGITSWGADENFKLTTTDGNYYSAYYEAGSEVEITGAFKIASGTEDWTPYNFGGNFLVQAGENYILVQDGGNMEVDGKILASRIEFFMETRTFKITGEAQENKFDVTTDQGVSLVTYVGEEITFMPLTFTQNGTYTGSYTVVDPEFTLKVAGDGNFNTIDYGTNGTPLALATPYTLHKNSFGSIAIADEIQVGDVLDVVVSIAEDWITASMLVTKQTTPIDPDDPQVDISYVVAGNGSKGWLNGIEWDPQAADNAMTDADSDGIYEVTYSQVPAGTYSFKVVANTDADVNWLGYGYLDTDNSSKGIPVVGSEENIGFTLDQTADVTIKFNTLTGKIILTTPSGSFDTVKIEYFHVRTSDDECLDEFQFTTENGNKVVFQLPAFENADGTFAVSCVIIGNCNYAVYEKYIYTSVAQGGNYTVTVQFNGDYENPEFTISAELIQEVTIDSFSILRDGSCNQYTFSDANNNTVIISQNVQLEVGETSRDLTFEVVGNCDVNTYYDVLRTTVSESGVYDVIIQFNGDYENPSFSIATAKGAMYLMGGINGWKPDANYKLTSTDGVNFVLEFPKGQELELSGQFKIASADWGVYNFGAGRYLDAVESGKTYTLDGLNDISIADNDVILVSKIEVNLFNDLETGYLVAALTITGVAQENLFDVNTDQGISFVEFNAGVENFNKLTFMGNGVYTGTYTYSADGVSFKVGGDGNFNVINYGTNGTDLVVGEAYIMQTGGIGSNVSFAPDADVLPGDVFDVAVVITSDWTVTLYLTKRDRPIDPDEPDVFISDISVPPFAETKVNASTQVTATFNIENATQATATIVGADANAFALSPVTIQDGVGSVRVIFSPLAIGVYEATLIIAAGDAQARVEMVAYAIEDSPSTAIEDAETLGIYAKEGTVYSEVEFEIYDLAGVNVTMLNGSLQGVYVVKTAEGNRLISVW